jgi:hypothetical protein
MASYLVWITVALIAAGVVVVVANAASHTPGRDADATFWRDLRAGLAARRGPGARGTQARDRAEAEPVDVPLDEFLRATQTDDGYVQLDELAHALSKAKDSAVRSVHVLGRRS